MGIVRVKGEDNVEQKRAGYSSREMEKEAMQLYSRRVRHFNQLHLCNSLIHICSPY